METDKDVVKINRFNSFQYIKFRKKNFNKCYKTATHL